jgi:DNA-binding MarR family transcriptional regulator
MNDLDPIINVPARLRIMAALTALNPSSQLDFRTLGKSLGLTDGNLGAHLQTLETAGYIKVEKSFVERKPRTHVAVTSKGRARFEAHVAALRAICRV